MLTLGHSAFVNGDKKDVFRHEQAVIFRLSVCEDHYYDVWISKLERHVIGMYRALL